MPDLRQCFAPETFTRGSLTERHRAIKALDGARRSTPLPPLLAPPPTQPPSWYLSTWWTPSWLPGADPAGGPRRNVSSHFTVLLCMKLSPVTNHSQSVDRMTLADHNTCRAPRTLRWRAKDKAMRLIHRSRVRRLSRTQSAAVDKPPGEKRLLTRLRPVNQFLGSIVELSSSISVIRLITRWLLKPA